MTPSICLNADNFPLNTATQKDQLFLQYEQQIMELMICFSYSLKYKGIIGSKI